MQRFRLSLLAFFVAALPLNPACDCGSNPANPDFDAGIDAGNGDGGNTDADAGNNDDDAGGNVDTDAGNNTGDDAGSDDSGTPIADGGDLPEDGGNNGGEDAGVDAGNPDAGNVDGGNVDAGPVVPACASDADCASGVCQFASGPNNNGITTVCASPLGERSRGDGCNDDNDCDHGSCLSGLCTAPCVTDQECGVNQVCGSAVVSRTNPDNTISAGVADVCLPNINLPEVACSSRRDCDATGRICADLEFINGNNGDLQFVCAQPTAGDVLLGGACTGDSLQNDQCRSGLCDDEGEGRCTAPCNADADCFEGEDLICTGAGFSNIPGARLCADSCVREQDCPTNRSCVRRSDAVDNRFETVCAAQQGAAATGTFVASAGECKTATTILVGGNPPPDQARYCTEFCVVDTDCPAAAPLCSTLNVTKPNGVGTQQIKLCTIDN